MSGMIKLHEGLDFFVVMGRHSLTLFPESLSLHRGHTGNTQVIHRMVTPGEW